MSPHSKHHKKRSNHKKKSKHKKSKRSSSSSSSSSSSRGFTNEDEIRLIKRLTEERERRIEEKKMKKELLKATETAEEKRVRRLLKKEMKERKRKQLMGWDNDYLHYTNNDNPFGDANLLSTFVWDKKLAKDGLLGVSREELESQNRIKMEENKRELEKVKKRRLERELERQKRDEEISLMQRSKEAAQFQEWERQEDQFHLEQARLRSQIRIEDGRAKPIDLLAKYIDAEGAVDAIEMHEPYMYLNGLLLNDLEDLVVDIKVYMELERGKNLDYWNDITLIVQDQLHKLRKLEMESEGDAISRRDGVNESVAGDIAGIFRSKTVAQLDLLEKQINDKINGNKEGLDMAYWESLSRQLKAYMAKVRLRDRHQKNLKHKLESLKAHAYETKKSTSKSETQLEIEPDAVIAEHDSKQPEKSCTYEIGNCSPKYINQNDLEPGTIIITEEDDLKRLEFARLQVLGTGHHLENVLTAEETACEKEARKGMTNEEVQFSVESTLDNQIYLWSDKYRPRKPRYFNRVHTGFEWNKYNQTHYDMDNPPPKIVQGYKFNIFYPDLIEKTVTPEYFLTPCPDNPEFGILRFHAGPPYEDIAFKVVHREWEYSYKKGFRCQFHNNIFQLWFHFKRYRYRR